MSFDVPDALSTARQKLKDRFAGTPQRIHNRITSPLFAIIGR